VCWEGRCPPGTLGISWEDGYSVGVGPRRPFQLPHKVLSAPPFWVSQLTGARRCSSKRPRDHWDAASSGGPPGRRPALLRGWLQSRPSGSAGIAPGSLCAVVAAEDSSLGRSLLRREPRRAAYMSTPNTAPLIPLQVSRSYNSYLFTPQLCGGPSFKGLSGPSPQRRPPQACPWSAVI